MLVAPARRDLADLAPEGLAARIRADVPGANVDGEAGADREFEVASDGERLGRELALLEGPRSTIDLEVLDDPIAGVVDEERLDHGPLIQRDVQVYLLVGQRTPSGLHPMR